MRIGLMTEYPSPSVQSGPAIHTRFLYERLMHTGHDVTLMGPDTGDEVPIDAAKTHLYKAMPYPTHPKVKIPAPGPWSTMWNAPRVDVVHSQTNTHMVHYAVWMRQMHRTALLNTHTVHLPTHSHFVLSDGLYNREWVRNLFRRWAESLERNWARSYNEGDCLIVQSQHLVDYWRERGVTVPIAVQGRPIDPDKFSRKASRDPFAKPFARGGRLLAVCRQDREKSLDQLIRIFDQKIAPNCPDASLTLVGDGHDRANLMAQANACASRDRIHFPGEVAHHNTVDWYKNADLFVYTSVSETFGNVVNEALWAGLPVVALDDRMGVAHQVRHEHNGFLVTPGTHRTDGEFAANVKMLLEDGMLRRRLSENAERLCHATSHPDSVVAHFGEIYGEAIEHAKRTIPVSLSERHVLRQKAALARRLATWSWWNKSLIWLAQLATVVGAGREAMPARQLPAASEEQRARRAA
ncbi:MAG: 1,2-diacylglycerol 3-alpha-glucosyltransferase [Myxococcota bacterium]|jgi:1,2-diacylglycerol 3-alpha-glucosyltransferase